MYHRLQFLANILLLRQNIQDSKLSEDFLLKFRRQEVLS
jgi:hypothetical protein